VERVQIVLDAWKRQSRERLHMQHSREKEHKHDRRQDGHTIEKPPEALPAFPLWIVENRFHAAALSLEHFAPAASFGAAFYR
jgi:hypothetical protein